MRVPPSELALGCFLLGADAAGLDLCARVILALHWFTGDATQHRDLPYVRQSVCNWSLKQTLTRGIKLAVRSQIIIKAFQRRVKPFDLFVPFKRFGIVPGLVTSGDRKRPIKQIADVRQNFPRRACSV